jgi:DNA-binding PucR family transcriptional regulator
LEVLDFAVAIRPDLAQTTRPDFAVAIRPGEHACCRFAHAEDRRRLALASDIAQEAVTTVLAPLSKLGGVRGERLIQTLHVYLDQQGSLTKTAEALNLHRNAVAYRIKNAFALLEVDRDNPDDLLLLQLACRARELS